MEEASDASGLMWDYFDDDWLYRSRSTGGYEPLPYCVMWHHTAGADNAWGDANYMCYTADARPICNICVDSKVGLLLAGGATNTNGQGQAISFSRGVVESDNMNQRAVGVEICNNGVGAPYPERQLDFVFALSNAINRRCGNRPEDVSSHQYYAPDRKVDPATAVAVQGPWRPRSVTSSGSWDVNDLRAECARRAAPPPPEPEPDLAWLAAT